MLPRPGLNQELNYRENIAPITCSDGEKIPRTTNVRQEAILILFLVDAAKSDKQLS